jgi:IS30 family transposase
MVFGVHFSRAVPESVRERFWEAVNSGLSPTAAATVAGVDGRTGRDWARSAGYQTNTKHYGIRYSRATRERFWEAMYSGAMVVEAAVIAGVSATAGQRWVTEAGYVPRTALLADIDTDTDTEPSSRPMSFIERCRLEELLETGHTPVQAAGLLGRHRVTIRREMCRGQTVSGYRARVGQDCAEANLKRPKPRHLESRPALLAEVVARLEKRHSPEQIAGRLREDVDRHGDGTTLTRV